jgi:hypothetical protein
MARDKAAQAERVAWEHAARDMRVALIGFAKEPDFVKDLGLGLGLFWQDRYAADTVHMMSVDESLRFFDWFAHDYRLQAAGPAMEGKRLVEVYRDQVGDALSDKEASMLDGWIASLPGSAFVLEQADPEQGLVVLCDLFIEDRRVTVHDTAAASHGEVGQILLARPLPEHEHVRLSGATVVLPASEKEALQAFVEQAHNAYRAEREEGGSAVAFLRERAYLLTHYALEWADRQGRPAVAAEDPDAEKPGQKTVQKLIRWGQERVQVR